MKIAQVPEFHFSPPERVALAAAVPDATWLDALPSDWARLVSFPDADQFLSDKEGYVSRMVEWAAMEALKENNYRTATPSAELTVVAEIANLARKLQRLLASPNSYRRNFATAFFGIELLGIRHVSGDAIYKHDALEELLGEIIEDEELVRNWMKSYHRADHLRRPKQRALSAFVSQLMCFWHMWTGKPAGKGTEGGPAARFVRDATNPLLSFADKELGETLRGSGLLDEFAAAQLIKSLA
ncbi:hypothetical protein ACFSQQ_16480 [Mesorhizobium kowhaii]|uniref:hypothetical protein n=1 Tax=Mesorhizobium kowhaii TaxID=1300272 RepID=UPI0035F0406D